MTLDQCPATVAVGLLFLLLLLARLSKHLFSLLLVDRLLMKQRDAQPSTSILRQHALRPSSCSHSVEMVKIFDNAVSRRGSTAGRGRCPTAPLCPTGTTTEPPALTSTSSPSHQVTQTPYDPLDPAQATGAPTECQPTGARRRRLEGERGRVAGLLLRRAPRFGNRAAST